MEHPSKNPKVIMNDCLALLLLFLEGLCSPGANAFDAIDNPCHSEPIYDKVEDRKNDNIDDLSLIEAL